MSCSASLEMVSYIYLKMSRGLKFQMLLPEVITLLSVIYGIIELQIGLQRASSKEKLLRMNIQLQTPLMLQQNDKVGSSMLLFKSQNTGKTLTLRMR